MKVNGTAMLVEERDAPGVPAIGGEADLFRVDVSGVASVRVGGDHLVIESWHHDRGLLTRRRR